MTTKFTPGPWVAELCHHKDAINITSESRDGFVGICDVFCGYKGEIEIEQQANAHLIAAAPDLYALAECEEALNSETTKGIAVLESYGWSYKDRFEISATEFVRRMRKHVMAKARGES